jgi:hypothetical protein
LDFEINVALLRWQTQFPDGVVYRVNAKTLRISESNLGGAVLLGMSAASEVEQQPISRVSEILASNLKSDMRPIEGAIEVAGKKYIAQATPIGTKFWLIRLRLKTNDAGREEFSTTGIAGIGPLGKAELHAEGA